MGVSNIIVLSVVIIMLLVVSVFIVELFIPINIKLEMNSICRNYLFVVEKNGELLESEKVELINSLENLNLKNIIIEIDSEGSKFGDDIRFVVTATLDRKSLTASLKRDIERIEIKYERKFKVKKIIN